MLNILCNYLFAVFVLITSPIKAHDEHTSYNQRAAPEIYSSIGNTRDLLVKELERVRKDATELIRKISYDERDQKLIKSSKIRQSLYYEIIKCYEELEKNLTHDLKYPYCFFCERQVFSAQIHGAIEGSRSAFEYINQYHRIQHTIFTTLFHIEEGLADAVHRQLGLEE